MLPSALVIFVYSVKSSHIHNQSELYERTMEGKMNTWNLRRWPHLCILTFLLLSPPSSPRSLRTSTLLKSISALLRPWDSIKQPSFLSSSFFPLHQHHTLVLLCSPSYPCLLTPLILSRITHAAVLPSCSPSLPWRTNMSGSDLTKPHWPRHTFRPTSNLVVSSLPLYFF